MRVSINFRENSHQGAVFDYIRQSIKLFIFQSLLKDIIAIAILAIISGADGWVAIEAYGNAKYEWLKSFLELPNGIPSHDTFSRVFALIEPQQFQECFLSWVNAIVGELELNAIALH